MGTQHDSGRPADDDGAFDVAWVEVSAAEAASGVRRTIGVPPDGRPVTVQVPAGVGDNMALRLPGAGSAAPRGGPARDLLVRIRVSDGAAAADPPGAPAARGASGTARPPLSPTPPPPSSTPLPPPPSLSPTPMPAPTPTWPATAADAPPGGDPTGSGPAAAALPSFDGTGFPPGAPVDRSTSAATVGASPAGAAGPRLPHPRAAEHRPASPGSGAVPGQPGGPQYHAGMPYPGASPYPPGMSFASGPAAPAGRTGRNTRIAVVAGLLTVLLLVGCCGGSWLLYARGTDGGPPLGSGVGASSAAPTTGSPAPPPTAVSPQQYQEALTTMQRNLAGAFDKLRAAKNPTAVAQAAEALAGAARAEGDRLAGLAAPAAVASAHAALVAALRQLPAVADDAGAAADSRQVCSGPAATALVSRAASVEPLRAAVRQLATADPARAYPLGAFLPEPTKDANRRLANGAYLTRASGGSGHLKIDNGGQVDMVVSVVKSGAKKPVTTVYVRARSKHTITAVKDGTYELFLASGADWDAKARRFNRDCGFSRFDDPLKFTTTAQEYTIWSVTLQATAGGNAATSDVDPNTFPDQ